MGRQRISQDTVVISANGQGAVWDISVGFVGDEPIVRRAKTAAGWGMEVVVHPLLPPIIAGSGDAVSAYAALSWAAGGRDVIQSAPAEVLALFEAVPVDEADLDICPDDQIEVVPEYLAAGE